MKLYHYVHCPFCIRVRMALNYLNISYESIVLAYNDETTPKNLTGVKMLPIATIDGENINESLQIIKKIDVENLLQNELTEIHQEQFNLLLDQIGKDVHNLAMPYWIWTPEFSNESRDYFQKKKEAKRGPFKILVKHGQHYIVNITSTLESLEKNLVPFFNSDRLTVLDIQLASHLWGLYIVPEFQFSKGIHLYLQKIKQLCHFNYHEDFWK